MEEWITQLAAQAPYIGIVGILLLTGFGVPLPEDIPLIIAGYLCGTGAADLQIMLPTAFGAIVGSDAIVFFLGRRYGHHVPKLPVLRRFLTEDRLARTEQKLHRHGGKFIFMARFLPGLRTAAFFTAGTFKIPFWKFLVYDGTAAAISAPTIILLAYFFADHLERVRVWVTEAQAVAALAVGLAIGIPLTIRWWLRRRRAARVRAKRIARADRLRQQPHQPLP